MSHAICLQRWISIGGNANAVVTQSAEDYADVALYQDCAFYAEIAALSGAPTLSVKSGPTRDEILWGAIQNGAGIPLTYTTAGFQPLRVYTFLDSAAPIARFIRWSATSASAWTLTFRIWMSLNQCRGAALTNRGQSGGGVRRGAALASMAIYPTSAEVGAAARAVYPTASSPRSVR